MQCSDAAAASRRRTFSVSGRQRHAVVDQRIDARRHVDACWDDVCLLQRHARHRTAHPALIADILSLLAGRKPAAPPAGPRPPLEPLSDSEIRVLRYLPTNLSAPQIASELHVSHNTVRTHMRHLYAKLGTHRRFDAVERGRALGLLAPSPLRGKATILGLRPGNSA